MAFKLTGSVIVKRISELLEKLGLASAELSSYSVAIDNPSQAQTERIPLDKLKLAMLNSGLYDDRGFYDASVNVFPSSGGSGTAGAILRGNVWTISVSGTLGGTAVIEGQEIRALVDNPGQTAANWFISLANVETTWGDITGTLSDQTDLNNKLDEKEQILTAGTNIAIDRTNPDAPVISSSGGGGSGNYLITNGVTFNPAIDLTNGDENPNEIICNLYAQTGVLTITIDTWPTQQGLKYLATINANGDTINVPTDTNFCMLQNEYDGTPGIYAFAMIFDGTYLHAIIYRVKVLSVPPTVVSITVYEGHEDEVEVVLSEECTFTNLGFLLSGTTDSSFTSVSGSGTNVLIGTLTNPIDKDLETPTLSYNSATGDVESISSSTPLASFTDEEIVIQLNTVLNDIENTVLDYSAASSGNATVDGSNYLTAVFDQSTYENDGTPSTGNILFDVANKFFNTGGLIADAKWIMPANAVNVSTGLCTVMIIGNFNYNAEECYSNSPYFFRSTAGGKDCYITASGGLTCNAFGTRTIASQRANIDDRWYPGILQGECVIIFSVSETDFKLYINEELIAASSTAITGAALNLNAIFGAWSTAARNIFCKNLHEYKILYNYYDNIADQLAAITAYAENVFGMDFDNFPTASDVVITGTHGVGDTLTLTWTYNQDGAGTQGDYYIEWKYRSVNTNIMSSGTHIDINKNDATLVIPSISGMYVQARMCVLSSDGLASRHTYLSDIIQVS